MIKTLYFIIISFGFLFISCNHPESKEKKTRKTKFVIRDEPVYNNDEYTGSEVNTEENNSSETIINMEKEGGVKFVWVEINDVRLKFIFDTGASDIFISPAEAKVLMKQGTLDQSDFLGSGRYQDASGNVNENKVINLRKVKIGNKTLHDVKASVSSNINTPLLLGQSALERFGRIEIDNINQRIILKD